MNKPIDRMETLREEIAKTIFEEFIRDWHEAYYGADQILSLIQKHLEEKLTVVNDHQVVEGLLPYWKPTEQCPNCQKVTEGFYMLSHSERDNEVAKIQRKHSLTQIKEILK